MLAGVWELEIHINNMQRRVFCANAAFLNKTYRRLLYILFIFRSPKHRTSQGLAIAGSSGTSTSNLAAAVRVEVVGWAVAVNDAFPNVCRKRRPACSPTTSGQRSGDLL